MDQSGDIILSIIDGLADENLDGIINAARQRDRALAYRKAATLKDGDKVRLCGNLSPKYLVGLEGTVSGQATGDRVPVDIGIGARRYRGVVRVPLACVEAVAA